LIVGAINVDSNVYQNSFILTILTCMNLLKEEKKKH